MLVIMFSNGNEKCWHIGERIVMDYDDVLNVVEVLADGHEFEWIKENFVNLPYPKNGPVVRWFGDMAKMIANALPTKF